MALLLSQQCSRTVLGTSVDLLLVALHVALLDDTGLKLVGRPQQQEKSVCTSSFLEQTSLHITNGGAYPALEYQYIEEEAHEERKGTPSVTRVSARLISLFGGEEILLLVSSSTESSSGSSSSTRSLRLRVDEFVSPHSFLSKNSFRVGAFNLRYGYWKLKIHSSLLFPLLRPHASCPTMTALPDHQVLDIFKYLAAPDALSVDMVCKRMHLLASSEDEWTARIQRDFGQALRSPSWLRIHVSSPPTSRLLHDMRASMEAYKRPSSSPPSTRFFFSREEPHHHPTTHLTHGFRFLTHYQQQQPHYLQQAGEQQHHLFALRDPDAFNPFPFG